MKKVITMAIFALLWYLSMAYVLLELNPLLWKTAVRVDFLIFLVFIELCIVTYPNRKESK